MFIYIDKIKTWLFIRPPIDEETSFDKRLEVVLEEVKTRIPGKVLSEYGRSLRSVVRNQLIESERKIDSETYRL